MDDIYELQAKVDQESARHLGALFDLYYHVELPGIIVEHNTPWSEAGLLTWALSPGDELEINVRSQVILGISSPRGVGWTQIILSVMGGVVLIAFVIWAIQRIQNHRRRQSRELDPLVPDPLQGEYSSWNEAMEDVEGVYVTDYDGSYIDTNEYEAELDDYM